MAARAGLDTELALQYVFERDGFYESLADKLLDATRTRRLFSRRSHWLCEELNDLARVCSTGTYIDTAKDGAARLLHTQLGAPKAIANVLAAGFAFGAKAALAPTIVGPANLTVVLRALVALVCPDLERCPAQTDVFKALLGPRVAIGLRAAAEGGGA